MPAQGRPLSLSEVESLIFTHKLLLYLEFSTCSAPRANFWAAIRGYPGHGPSTVRRNPESGRARLPAQPEHSSKIRAHVRHAACTNRLAGRRCLGTSPGHVCRGTKERPAIGRFRESSPRRWRAREGGAAEQSFAQFLAAADLASVTFTSKVTRDAFLEMARIFGESGSKPEGPENRSSGREGHRVRRGLQAGRSGPHSV